MFNQTAKKVFDESIDRALAVPPGELVAAEAELNYASGLVSYGLFRGDITHEQAELMHMRVRAARQRRVALLIRQSPA